jgi:hypothetical protein
VPTQRVANTAAGVALTLATEIAVVTVTPQAPSNQVDVPGPNVQVQATIIITGAASATNCTLKLRRGAGTGGTDILASDPVVSVPASAIDVEVTVTAQETAANFNAASGTYTLTANAAGAAQTARLASVEVQDLAPGV